VPPWVSSGALYHIRVRVALDTLTPLTHRPLATALLDSVRFYHESGRWHCALFLLMPDHWHALISFPLEKRMGEVIGDWKRHQFKTHGIAWQTNFFDHRLRNEHSSDEKYTYILNNPAAKKLCAKPEDWPWIFKGGARPPGAL
jgi:hypothetical protein